MKRIISIAALFILMLAFVNSADAHRWGRGPGWGYRPYCPPVPAPYCRPYYPPAPVFRDRWIQPHWRRTPYGDQWIPGHWKREQIG